MIFLAVVKLNQNKKDEIGQNMLNLNSPLNKQKVNIERSNQNLKTLDQKFNLNNKKSSYKQFKSFKAFKYLFEDIIEQDSEAVFRAAWILALALLSVCLCCVGVTAMLRYAKEATIRMKMLEQMEQKEELNEHVNSEIEIDAQDQRQNIGQQNGTNKQQITQGF